MKTTSFNSKMVRLKALMVAVGAAIILCFNSKMVRLKVRMAKIIDNSRVFQFQNGAIKSFASLIAPSSICRVSIPKWCD